MITIFSVNGEYFTNYDLAVLKASGTNYIIKSHDVNDTVDLEVETDGLNISVCDEYNNEINVEFQLELEDTSSYEWGDGKDYYAVDLGINGRSLESLNLSKELQDRIIHECDNLAIKKTDDEFSRR